MNKKYTVLHTEASLGWGGQEKRIMRIMAGVTKAGHRVLLACDKSSKIYTAAQEQGIEVFHRSHKSTIDPLAIYGYMSLIKSEGVDIVHTHSSRDGWNAGIASRISSKKPVVIRTRHLAGRIANAFVYKKLADKVVTVGAYMGNVFVDEYGVDPAQVQTIRTGIDLDFFNPEKKYPNLREHWGCAKDDVVIIQVAVLRGKKGHRVLLRALKTLIDAGHTAIKVVIVGDGPMRNSIEELITELHLREHVIMAGQQSDIPAYLANANIFCLPSFEEALGTSLLEAMAMGLPAVASRVGGIPEIVDQQRGGLFTVDDSEECAGVLKPLVESSILLKHKAEAARQYAQSTASLTLMVDETLELYETMLTKS